MKHIEPDILTANTYYWRPSASAHGRRSNEQFRLSEIERFFKQIGLVEIKKHSGSVSARTHANRKERLEVEFTYSESCRNVYKHFLVRKNGKRSNITALRKLYN